MECMACSDNVVRAGLTPKLKDVDTLCEMLDYRCRTKEEIIFSCTQSPSNPFVTVYDPPVPDFTIARIQVSETTMINYYYYMYIDLASHFKGKIIISSSGSSTNSSSGGGCRSSSSSFVVITIILCLSKLWLFCFYLTL